MSVGQGTAHARFGLAFSCARPAILWEVYVGLSRGVLAGSICISPIPDSCASFSLAAAPGICMVLQPDGLTVNCLFNAGQRRDGYGVVQGPRRHIGVDHGGGGARV